jgi:prolyl-tRNA synthetase
MGWRVHEKLAQIVREEMNRINAVECFMPVLVPKEFLEETGRHTIDVLFSLKDRSKRDFFLGFTHEEPVTDIFRGYVSSWKALPLSLYQIQTKFRDEARPRAGLIRAREFTMKDSYSFDVDKAGLDKSFADHKEAYERIFKRCGVDYLAVDADSGAIGGSESTEFMILAETGEDSVLRCGGCGYAANAERAEIGGRPDDLSPNAAAVSTGAISKVVETPGAHTVAQVCDFLKVEPTQLVKTIICTAGGRTVAALVRGDRELNLPKFGRFLGAPVELADAETVKRVTNAEVGFAGPVGLSGVQIVCDYELVSAQGLVVGANQTDAHRTDVAIGVDFKPSDYADIRTAIEGDLCNKPGCSGSYSEAHGIEVGHIFKLGTKYSKAMRAQVQNENGQSVDVEMGCYGLGVSRTMQSAIEAFHDQDGILWPISIAPFEVVIVVVNSADEAQSAAAQTLYDSLVAAGIDVLYDDRDERSGPKFKDADLIGYPVKVVVGRGLAEGKVEVTLRKEKAIRHDVAVTEAADFVRNLVAEEYNRLSAD